MKRILFIGMLSLLIAPLVGLSGWGNAQAKDQASFSDRDIQGPYGFSFDGLVIGPAGLVPVGAVGQFEADGAGTFPRLVRTLNLGGGAGIQQFEGGKYQVNPDGTGFACFCGDPPQQIPGVPPLIFDPVEEAEDQPGTFEVFSFVITGEDKDEAEFVGISLRLITETCPLDQGVSCPPAEGDQDTLDQNLTPAELTLGVVQGAARTQSGGSEQTEDGD